MSLNKYVWMKYFRVRQRNNCHRIYFNMPHLVKKIFGRRQSSENEPKKDPEKSKTKNLDPSGLEEQKEAAFHNIETKLQYLNQQPMPFLIERHMLKMTVDQVKRGLLALDLLSHVQHSPEQLKMCLLLPPDALDNAEYIFDMDDQELLKTYMAEFTCCIRFKLLPV